MKRLGICVDCNKSTSHYKYKRCIKCSNKGVNNPSHGLKGELALRWLGGNSLLPNCIDCGKKLSHRSSKRCRSCANTKSLNPGWLGGIMNKPYDSNFTEKLRDKIRAKSKYCCSMCGISEKKLTKKLDIHHINYNKIDSSELNLIALCHVCHMKTNKNRPKWIKYFTQAKIPKTRKTKNG